MKKKQILVCGTGFGKIYLKAIAESKEYELMGILGKGSDRSRLLSKNLNVPMYTDIKEINQNVDAACVVVPNAAGGGNGANIAKRGSKYTLWCYYRKCNVTISKRNV